MAQNKKVELPEVKMPVPEKRKSAPRMVPEREFFMSIQNPIIFRKNLLEASKSTLSILKAVHEIKEYRTKKHIILSSLQNQMREIKQLVQKAEELLPSYSKQDAIRHFPKVMVAPRQKMGVVPIGQKTLSELDKIHEHIATVDSKMQWLHDTSAKEGRMKDANNELMQTLGNLNKKLKTL